MSEDNRVTEHRRKRIKRLKKCIILMLVTVIVLPLIVSLCLLAEVYSLKKTLEGASVQMDNLALTAAGQQQELELLAGKVQALEQRMAEADRAQPPTGQPTQRPTEPPTGQPTQRPTEPPTGQPTQRPTEPPTGQPTQRPTEPPTGQPTQQPSETGVSVQGSSSDAREPKEIAEVTAAHKVYLTFDDGPSIYTQEILDILDRYEVKATFFVLGKEKETLKDMLKSIADAGHTIGMHSYSHKYAEIYESVESFAEDYEKIRNYIYDTTGIWSTIYRFPGGSSNKISTIPMETFAKYLDGQNIVFFDWNSASGDGVKELLPVDTLVENSMKGILKRDETVILMHDAASKRTTVDALPTLIESILALEDTVILPITENTKPIQHIHWSPDTEEQQTEERMED